MEQTYSMAAAAALLDVDVATLRRWCAKARIYPTKAAHDKRSHVLTAQQVQALAQERGRSIEASQGTDSPALQERIAALESSTGALSALLQEILQRIEALEQRSQADQSRPAQPAPRPAAPALPLDRGASIDATRPTGPGRSADALAGLAPRSSYAPGASMRPGAGALPPPVRALVAAWIAEHGGPAKDTVRRWLDMPLEPAAALRFTQQKIAELGYRAHGAALHRCDNAQCVCYQVLPA